jgi:hypothetical protein
MTEVPRLLRLSLVLSISLIVGCSFDPTYKKQTLATELQDILTNLGLTTQVKLLEHTLAVQVDMPNSLVQVGQQIGIGPKFQDTQQEVIPLLHRVIMSSDAEINFYLVLVTDPLIPGAYLTLLRNMEDIKRLNVSMLDTEEFLSRTVFELNYIGSETPVDIDTYIQRDITLEEFLSWQLARRIQQQLVLAFAQTDHVEVGRCAGQFYNDKFTFTLNVVPTDTNRIDEDTIRSSFKTAADLIERVLNSYAFDRFTSVRLVHYPTGRDLVLPRHTLKLPY